ncbi:MAG: glycosyltransferase family 4 protein [Rhodospirillales bacterium]|nr:glycosyltransferase family 4 protein [Rhodospirillales bacterium]
MRIAIASSGLGHIQRGIEAWASDVADALRRRKLDVSLFGHQTATGPHIRPLRYVRRTDSGVVRAARLARALGAWRIGIANAYDVEQVAMALPLWRAIRRDFDILHVQDPLLARILDHARRLGLSRPRVILANGTGESTKRLAGLSAVQELTPDAYEQLVGQKKPGGLTFMIPNFVDVAMFDVGNQAEARKRFDLPGDAFIVLTAAAIRRFHKRIDYLIAEFARALPALPANAILVIAGGVENDTAELMTLGKKLLGDRVRFLTSLPRAEMPTLYRTADLFVLTSLFETFGIVLLEAMATGLPVLCHEAPVFRYVAGPAGRFCDMTREGALATSLAGLAPVASRHAAAAQARRHVADNFSEAPVVDQMLDMYQRVLKGGQ